MSPFVCWADVYVPIRYMALRHHTLYRCHSEESQNLVKLVGAGTFTASRCIEKLG